LAPAELALIFFVDWPKECAAVIPCFNEQAAIGAVVKGVCEHLPTVFVVDDGSTDRTATAAEQVGAIALVHKANRGKGAALRTGWQRALERGFRWAMTLDGDGQHLAEHVPAFFECAERTGAALVAGNRMTHAGDMPWVRRVVNRWMSRRISKAAGRLLPDSQCGFRLMNLDAWSELPLATTHFEIESEVLLAFVARGYAVEFVPVRAIYEGEHSKIHPVRDTVRWLKWWRGAKGSGRQLARLNKLNGLNELNELKR